MSVSLPEEVTAGEAVRLSGRVPGAPTGAEAVLEQERNGGWVVLVVSPVRRGLFSLLWRPAREGGAILRVVARRRGRGLAVSQRGSVRIAFPPGYCPEPSPPTSVPAGDGWLVGGKYLAGGPAPGIFECTGGYTASVTDDAGAVVASQQIVDRESFLFVLPAGGYTVAAGSCGIPAHVTVSAGQSVKAEVICSDIP